MKYKGKKRAYSSSDVTDNCSTPVKKQHISVFKITNREQKEEENGKISDLSLISNDDTFLSTSEALNQLLSSEIPLPPDTEGDEETPPHTQEPVIQTETEMVTLPLKVLNDIFEKLTTIQEENKVLKETICTVQRKVDNIDTKIDMRASSSSTLTASPSEPFSNVNQRSSSPHINPPPTTNDKNLKHKVIPNWGKRFHFRRNQYRNADKNLKQAAIYSGFLEENQPYVPKKFRPKFWRDEYDFKLMEKNSLQEMETQKSRWLYYADVSTDKYKDVDAQIIRDLNKHPNPIERDYLLELWKKETSTAEHRAETMNERELVFMSELPKRDPYSGFVESARKGNHYKRNYYRTPTQFDSVDSAQTPPVRSSQTRNSFQFPDQRSSQ